MVIDWIYVINFGYTHISQPINLCFRHTAHKRVEKIADWGVSITAQKFDRIISAMY